jgi:Pyruvate:ferredoxin oxidoreductase and related 2-oxoacid:ferredoxin oxidoreductases, alpha subunit
MTRLRAQKVAGIAGDIPELEVDDPDGDAKVLVVGWGGTYGPIAAGCRRVRRGGGKVAHAHLTHLNPFPRNTGEVLRRYEKVLVPEMNLGQLLKLVRAEFLVDAVGYNRVSGLPLRAGEVEQAILALVERMSDGNGNGAEADGEGLPHRPGGALVPGLRRLRDPRRRCSRSCRSSGSSARTPSSSAASAARRASRTT